MGCQSESHYSTRGSVTACVQSYHFPLSVFSSVLQDVMAGFTCLRMHMLAFKLIETIKISVDVLNNLRTGIVKNS